MYKRPGLLMAVMAVLVGLWTDTGPVASSFTTGSRGPAAVMDQAGAR